MPRKELDLEALVARLEEINAKLANLEAFLEGVSVDD